MHRISWRSLPVRIAQRSAFAACQRIGLRKICPGPDRGIKSPAHLRHHLKSLRRYDVALVGVEKIWICCGEISGGAAEGAPGNYSVCRVALPGLGAQDGYR